MEGNGVPAPPERRTNETTSKMGRVCIDFRHCLYRCQMERLV